MKPTDKSHLPASHKFNQFFFQLATSLSPRAQLVCWIGMVSLGCTICNVRTLWQCLKEHIRSRGKFDLECSAKMCLQENWQLLLTDTMLTLIRGHCSSYMQACVSFIGGVGQTLIFHWMILKWAQQGSMETICRNVALLVCSACILSNGTWHSAPCSPKIDRNWLKLIPKSCVCAESNHCDAWQYWSEGHSMFF